MEAPSKALERASVEDMYKREAAAPSVSLVGVAGRHNIDHLADFKADATNVSGAVIEVVREVWRQGFNGSLDGFPQMAASGSRPNLAGLVSRAQGRRASRSLSPPAGSGSSSPTRRAGRLLPDQLFIAFLQRLFDPATMWEEAVVLVRRWAVALEEGGPWIADPFSSQRGGEAKQERDRADALDRATADLRGTEAEPDYHQRLQEAKDRHPASPCCPSSSHTRTRSSAPLTHPSLHHTPRPPPPFP
jgi:hypothetical protein